MVYCNKIMNRSIKKFTKFVRDPLWGNITLSDGIYEIVKSKEFRRLQNIKQLGPTHILYPGAVHTRENHSLGVYHLSKKLLFSLLEKDTCPWITETGVYSFLCAALLHDIGHFPFTHSLKELSTKTHESLTGDMILNDSLGQLIKKAGASPEMTAEIIDTGRNTKDEETLFFRKLLSGVLDPDKLDYLNRDAFFCGVPYGLQDTEYVLNSLLPSKEKGIEILSKNIMSVENILFSKYLMYKSVYWHKTVRIATGMMKKFLFEAVSSGEITFPRLYSMDDNEIKNFVIESKEEYASIGKDLFSGNIYPVIYEKKVLSPLKIENLKERKKVETELALKLRAKGFDCNYNDIIIDIPENISFEADLYVKDEGCFFPESSTVFTKEIIKEFTNSLRKVRIAVKNGHNIPDEIFFSIAQEVKLD